jgi:riboflavin kinase
MEVETLKKLAMLGATRGNVDLSSTTFASTIGTSAQTAARRLAMLEGDGFITRIVTNEGQKVRITEKGMNALRSEFLDYKKLFEEDHINKVTGKVVTGLGEGQYYISLEGYRSQFIQKLGFDPYPGTLNIKLKEPFAHPNIGYIKIDGFKDLNRTFGGCRCYPIKINEIRAAIIRPDRSSYPENLVEIIAPVNLRKTLSLKDGDEVEVLME